MGSSNGQKEKKTKTFLLDGNVRGLKTNREKNTLADMTLRQEKIIYGTNS